MGSDISKPVLVLGLHNAGKTTTLQKLGLGEIKTTTPSPGFNVKTIDFKGFIYTFWDVGGQYNYRSLWKQYYERVQGIIFVVDANDRDRIPEAREELHYILNESELRNKALLVFANKQDCPGAMNTDEVADNLGLHSIGERPWHIQSACATSGQGLEDGMNWVSRYYNYKF